MNKAERILKVLNGEEPDKIPIFENCLNPDVTIKMCGIYKLHGLEKLFDKIYPKLAQTFQAGFLGSFQGDNIEKLIRNYSFIPEIAHLFWKSIDAVAVTTLISKGVYQRGNELVAVSTDYDVGILKDGNVEATTLFMPEDENAEKEDINRGLCKQAELLIDKYNKGKDLKLKADVFSRVCRNFKNKILVVPSTNGFYETWIELCGNKFRTTYTRLVENAYKGKKEPIDLNEVWDAKEKYLGKLFSYLGKKDVKVIFLTDDLAWEGGPFHNPKVFDKLLFPRFKNLVEIAHSEDMKVIFHTDGKLHVSLLKSIVDSGFDGLHPIETPLNNPLKIVKKYGDKITLLCNIPKYPESELQKLSKEDVERLTIKYFLKLAKKMLAKKARVIACLGGNSFRPGCSLSTIEAQHNTIKRIDFQKIRILEGFYQTFGRVLPDEKREDLYSILLKNK